MLLKALSDRASWPEPHRSLRLAVNLSGRDLLDPTLPGTVRAFLAGGERSLTVEVTERGLGSEPAEIRPTLSALSALGVSFSIDDFGTGSSSLSHLVDLPVSEVKVDRSFVSAMGTDPKHRAIVQATVELAHAVGSSVTAEGIEDAATWALLAQMGCDAAQGYFVSRPMPSDEVVSWMTAKWQPTLGARN
jgi:EAL domain-containing protein (putative c-di-GMP-specific phosphodiesterase class I)